MFVTRTFSIGLSAITLLVSAAQSAVVTLRVSPPTSNFAQAVTVKLDYQDGSSRIVPVGIDPVAHASPGAKAVAIATALTDAGVSAQPLAIGEVKIDGGPNLKEVSFETGGTGERSDMIKSPDAIASTVSFEGLFNPFAAMGQPAVFTAGIVTDVGEVTVQVSAAELNFQTDGPIICQALFQRLAPHAPLHGAEILFAGDRIEVYFDPAYTVSQGGIIFGTTSSSPGCGGAVEMPPPPGVLFGVDTPTNLVPRALDMTFQYPDGLVLSVETAIDPLVVTTATQKCDRVAESLSGAGFIPAPTGDPTSCGIGAVPPGTQIRMVDQGTGERKDELFVWNPSEGHVAFPGFFEPFDRNGQPAIFTAGIVTDVGELTVQVTAEELNFQTDGPIICQALFQRLAPRAPDHGGQILFAGDRLEVYFDPAYSITMGGITFGTTSLTPGAEGMVVVEPPPAPVVPGDMNCDGDVNGLDIAGFILAVIDRNEYEGRYPGCNYLNGDLDGDGLVTQDDLDLFLPLLVP